MQRFTQLFRELDETRRADDKVAALRRYFAGAGLADAAWALWFLRGNRLQTGITPRRLRQWAAELSGHPDWLVEACCGRAGDVAETAALLLPLAPGAAPAPALHAVVEQHLLPLKDWDDRFQLQLLRDFWLTLTRDQALVLNKLISGGLRLHLPEEWLARALAQALGREPAAAAHYTASLVLLHAHAERSGKAARFTRYTLAARDGERLVPVVAVEPEMTPAEIRAVDEWINAHALASRGPVRTVPPGLVFEIRFTGVEPAARRKSGITLGFARLLGWRSDLQPADADTLERLRGLLAQP